MPYDSWSKLHNRPKSVVANMFVAFRCPKCLKERKATPHIRKIFLVAERLSWIEGRTSVHEKSLNEELNWAVNYELGILDPFVEDTNSIPGGRKSQLNKWHPYKNEYEMGRALNLVFLAEDLTETTWSLWIGVQLDLQKMLGGLDEEEKPQRPSKEADKSLKNPLQVGSGNRTRAKTPEGIEMIDLAVSPDLASNRKLVRHHSFGLPTPPSSFTSMNTKSDRAKLSQQGQTDPSIKASGKPVAIGNANGERMQSFERFIDSVSAKQTTIDRPSENTILNSPSYKLYDSKTKPKLPVIEPPEPSSYFNQDHQIVSYKSLQDFYSLLDQIERTSYVGAMFLEAYAEHLRDDLCRDCWLKHNVDFTQTTPDEDLVFLCPRKYS